jgi:hypothetical protein
VRNRGNLAEYQQVVGAVLAEQVDKAAARARIQTLSEQDIADAHEHPERVAARHCMDPGTLLRMISGDLDTVLGACIDHSNGPHAAAGQPCRASFMLWLSCPCARATPTHLPVQVLVHDELERRRAAVTPLRWAQRFALPHAQLTDLLGRAWGRSGRRRPCRRHGPPSVNSSTDSSTANWTYRDQPESGARTGGVARRCHRGPGAAQAPPGQRSRDAVGVR